MVESARFSRARRVVFGGACFASVAACNAERDPSSESDRAVPARAVFAQVVTPSAGKDPGAAPNVTLSRTSATPNASAGSITRAASPPAPLLSFGLRQGRGPLRVGLQEKTIFKLQHPTKLGWSDVYVGAFTAFIPNGDTESVHRDRASGEATHTFRVPGSTAVGLCVGPKALAGKGNAWALVTHCTKLAFEVGGSGSASLPLQKFGQPIEVRPVMTLERLDRGAPLPLLFYYESAKQRQAPVMAYRPDGTVERQVTNSGGLAEFDVSLPGRYVIQIVKAAASGDRIGELVFDVGGAR